ncbi:hypothetical protein B0H11DRAFT_1916012 [Mycena galericulata]|nr:hypothetical protein B0H11DRAFT_1916012 [Mycena galericulata]
MARHGTAWHRKEERHREGRGREGTAGKCHDRGFMACDRHLPWRWHGVAHAIKIGPEFRGSGIKIIVEFSVCEDGMKEKAEDIVGRKEHDLAGGFPNAKFAQTRTAVPFADTVTPCSHVHRDCGMGREINSREGAARYLSAWQSDQDVEDTEGATSQMDMLRRVCAGL